MRRGPLALVLVPALLAAASGVVRADAPPKPSPSPSPSARSFTDEDLKKIKIQREGPPPPSPSPGAKGAKAGPSPILSPSPTPMATPDPQIESKRAADEAYWRGRARAAREALAKAEARIPELEARIAGLRTDRDPTNVADPNREQTRQAEMAKAMAELDAARADLARARQAMDDLEDEARRKGALPGWLREP